jgi:hypothetical protein
MTLFVICETLLDVLVVTHTQNEGGSGHFCLLKFVKVPGCNTVCVLLPLENLLWVKLRDYAISRVNPNPRQVFLMRVVKM